MTRITFLAISIGVCLSNPVELPASCPSQAFVALQPTKRFPDLRGDLFLNQEDPDSPVKITGKVTGLPPGFNGFHVHMIGNITGDDCLSTGSHFNPFGEEHGGPDDTRRHVGDLGNIQFVEEPTEEAAVARINIEDSEISLCGERNVIGRAIVVHAGPDDLGRGRNEESQKTGNAGPRAGCGIVEETEGLLDSSEIF
uniref:Superoxide dismutase [Cu-Zn] n=1 Tax=Artemia franciscana TaxID=6661 RepID=A0A2R4QMA2_ARTSF|nr:superoxidase dismutase [Artemia franciscana]